jgi:hypothetical protein
MDKKFGKEAKDKITGFKGIITAKCEYIYGCTQYGLTPKTSKNGEQKDIGWFDEGRINIIGKGIEVKEVKSEKNGCENQPHPKI